MDCADSLETPLQIDMHALESHTKVRSILRHSPNKNRSPSNGVHHFGFENRCVRFNFHHPKMRSFLIVAIVLVASALEASAEKARFDNYKVYALHIATAEQHVQLRTLEDENRYQFWSLPHTGSNATIMVAPHQAADFQDLVVGLGLESWLQVENVQK